MGVGPACFASHLSYCLGEASFYTLSYGTSVQLVCRCFPGWMFCNLVVTLLCLWKEAGSPFTYSAVFTQPLCPFYFISQNRPSCENQSKYQAGKPEDFRFIIKGYNSEAAIWKTCVGQALQEGAHSSRACSRGVTLPAPWPAHQPGSLSHRLLSKSHWTTPWTKSLIAIHEKC